MERFVDRLLVLVCDELTALERAGLPLDLWMRDPRRRARRRRAGRSASPTACAPAARDPRRIVWAFGSRALRPDAPAGLHVLTRLRVLGYGLCLDGFGAGPHATARSSSASR